MKELEIIQYPKMKGVSVFFDTVEYRTAHFHPDWELLWLLDQDLAVIVQSGRSVLHPGQMVLFAPNEAHEFHKLEKEATFVCLQLSPEALPALPPITVEDNFLHHCRGEEDMETLRRSMTAIARAYFSQGENWELRCLGESCLLLADLLKTLPHHPLSPEEAAGRDTRNARLDRLIRFVDENYMHRIRLSDFAQAEGCSMGYLSRFIKKTMNQSFQEYVKKVRFNAACQLIAEGELQMLDVCFESGFSDYRYFSRAFREQYHMTPEEYSRSRGRDLPERMDFQHSLHSVERFYSGEENRILIEKYLNSFEF